MDFRNRSDAFEAACSQSQNGGHIYVYSIGGLFEERYKVLPHAVFGMGLFIASANRGLIRERFAD